MKRMVLGCVTGIMLIALAMPLWAAPVGDVLIDELYYDPDGTDTGFEYIILYNTTVVDIDLTDWEIQWGGTSFTYGTYAITGVVINAGASVIFGGDLMTPAPDVVYNFNFQNGGTQSDGVRIVDDLGAVIDTVIYDSPNDAGLAGDGGFDPYPDAMCASDPSGKTLTRDELHTDTDDCSLDFTEGVPIGGCPDADQDGFDDEACGGDDCDDTDPAVNPDAVEVCDNQIDDDCDGDIDMADTDCSCWDIDQDGFDDIACGGDDCDDADPAVYPGAAEDCLNQIDDDCDTLIDEADPDCNEGNPGDVLIDEVRYDADGSDGGYEYIVLYNTTEDDIDMTGWEIQWGGTDFTYGVYEIAGVVIPAGESLLFGGDLMAPAPDVVYNFNFQNGGNESDGIRLADGPGAALDTLIYDSPNTYGLPGDGGYDPYPDEMCAEDAWSGSVLTRDDLHTDTDDCSVDFIISHTFWCEDIDVDGFYDEACGGEDCDDTNPDIHPDAIEICDDLVDNDCDGYTDMDDWDCDCPDQDEDGYTHDGCGGDDCDDWDETINPGADEICDDLVDNDCDELVDMDDPDCMPVEFTLDLTASYDAGTLSLGYTIGTPEDALWANYLILISPSVQVIPLWSLSLPAIDPPLYVPISFPLPAMGVIGFYTGLFTAGGVEAIDLEWVDTSL